MILLFLMIGAGWVLAVTIVFGIYLNRKFLSRSARGLAVVRSR